MRLVNILLLTALSVVACEEAGPAGTASPEPAPGGAVAAAPETGNAPPRAGDSGSRAETAAPSEVWSYEVVRVHPHDPSAFTQGLAYRDGFLYEGTGQRGASSLRRVEIETGRVEQLVPLPASLFGEGITILGDRVYQLTWTARIGFVYDLATLEPVRQFRQVADGWGLTSDGERLIQSDGSQRLYFLDLESLAPVRTIDVSDAGSPVGEINELEFVDGEIWANVWHSEQLLRISPRDGTVLGRIDLAGLLDPGTVRDPEAVLNGIAYDPDTGRIWVTGKLWPSLFEIRVRESP